jgi:parvulin-like peptidyl-prolyl isomerase
LQKAGEHRLESVPKPVSAEVRRLMVRRVIERRVRIAKLRSEAEAKGFFDRPDVRMRAQMAEEKELAADFVASEIAAVRAAPALVEEAVARRVAAAQQAEVRKFSHIYLRAAESDSAARAAAGARMQEIVAALQAGTGFNVLAERYSDSVMARGGGHIDWTPRGNLQPDAAAAVFALSEGQVSPVVATRDGLHLFRLDGVRAATAVDSAAIRAQVQAELDADARIVAERALRQRELDAAGAELATAPKLVRALEAGKNERVARWSAGEVGAEELRGVVDRSDLSAALRELVENRLLAARRRGQPIPPALAEKVEDAKDAAMLDAYRAQLIEGLVVAPTEEEIARYYRDNAEAALFLRDFQLDALYFPQGEGSVADVYSAGEAVVAALRGGATFDALLDRPARRNAVVCRDAHGVDLEAMGKESPRLRKAILDLDIGAVSAAVYLDGPLTRLAAEGCALEGKGVAFVRLRDVRTQPLDRVRTAIRTELANQKERAGIDAIQARLVAESGLEILVPEG